MSDIDKIIEKYRIRMAKALPTYVRVNAAATFIMQDAVREAVEAERERIRAEIHKLRRTFRGPFNEALDPKDESILHGVCKMVLSSIDEEPTGEDDE